MTIIKWEIGLILALCILAALFLVLWLRSRKQNQISHDKKIHLDPQQFLNLLNINGKTGSIGDVASRVSNLMKTTFSCDVIIFMRKKRGQLIANFGHGLGDMRRNELRLPFSRKLFEVTSESFAPRLLSEIESLLPVKTKELLKSLKVELFFPVFWRENLYGIYFIKPPAHINRAEFDCYLSSMAQCLSAAYHIKWHETKKDRLEIDLLNMKKELEGQQGKPTSGSPLLDLIKHRSTETLIPKLVDLIKSDVGLKRVVFFYRSSDGKRSLQVVKNGLKKPVKALSDQNWKSLTDSLSNGSVRPLDKLKISKHKLDGWVRDLQANGLGFVAPFSLSDDYGGVLAFASDTADVVDKKLRALNQQVRNLVENVESYRQVEEMSYTDELTGLSNKRYLLKRLDEEISRARRHERTLAYVIFDLDELKQVNDNHGHQAGDAILRQLGEILRMSTRSIDIVARYGGDEFCIVMPETDSERTTKFMNRLQQKIARQTFKVGRNQEPVSCTISLGGAIYPQHGKSSDELFFAADMALLKAKERGRNMALLADEVDRPT